MVLIKTAPDLMLEMLQADKEKKLPLAEIASKLNTDVSKVERWAGFLKEYLAVEYPTNVLSRPYVKIVKPLDASPKVGVPPGEVLSSYTVSADNVSADVSIIVSDTEPVPIYSIQLPEIGRASQLVLKGLANELTNRVPVGIEDISDQRKMASLKAVFEKEAKKIVETEFAKSGTSPEALSILSGVLLHNCYGLGEVELLISDGMLEEICINSSHTPLGAYHIKHGWVKTNMLMPAEREIYNLAAQIARKAGTNITNLDPLMDAHLLSGDRANATLFPISSFGDTITIRKFARVPWTATNLLKEGVNTVSPEIAALLWLCIQYELNIIVTGGTASGKTSMLNAICALIPANQRIVSIEGTRELNLPEYLRWNWIPLTTRNKNPEGKGEITMLDLIANSLRMRPDRIIMGEVRRREEAEVLFEAMHTGHSVYATVHADTSRHLVRRMTKPPFELPTEDIESIDLIIVQFRDRRKGIRRTIEVAEVMQSDVEGQIQLNYLYRWDPRSDEFEKVNDSKRLFEKLNLYTGLTNDEIKKDLAEKTLVLEWMRDSGIEDIDAVGQIMGEYYLQKDKLLDKIKNGPIRQPKAQAVPEGGGNALSEKREVNALSEKPRTATKPAKVRAHAEPIAQPAEKPPDAQPGESGREIALRKRKKLGF